MGLVMTTRVSESGSQQAAPKKKKVVKVHVLRCRDESCKALLAFEETEEGYLLGQVLELASVDVDTRFFPCPKCNGRLLVEEYEHDGKLRVRVYGFEPAKGG
jgi:hypothetical protein